MHQGETKWYDSSSSPTCLPPQACPALGTKGSNKHIDLMQGQCWFLANALKRKPWRVGSLVPPDKFCIHLKYSGTRPLFWEQTRSHKPHVLRRCSPKFDGQIWPHSCYLGHSPVHWWPRPIPYRLADLACAQLSQCDLNLDGQWKQPWLYMVV